MGQDRGLADLPGVGVFTVHDSRIERFNLIAALSVAVVVAPGSLSPAVASGVDFGRHVSSCAQDMGLDSAHNPGMHRGYTGWDPGHEC